MKKLLLSLSTLCSFALNDATAQNFNDARQYFNTIEQQIKHDTLLMSYPALNVLMAKKVNTYLTGSSDLSLNKSYFIIDPTDGRLFLGYNISKAPSKTNTRTKWVLTTGVKSNIADAFSTIYAGDKKKAASDMGLSLKLTRLGRGVIFYANDKQVQRNNLKIFGLEDNEESEYSQKEVASYYRAQFKNELETSMKLDSVSFENTIQNVGTSAYRALKRQTFYEERNKYYRTQFITMEADNIDNEAIYNSFWNNWISLDVYIPFTKQEFDVANDFYSSVTTKSLYNFEGTLLWSHIYENAKTRWFGSIGLGATVFNSINTSMIDKYSIGNYKKLGGTDTLNLAQLETNDIYIGAYSDYLTPFFRAQIVSLFLAKRQIGLSFMAEKYINSYNPLNLKLGIPFSLTGKDDETKVDFELQFRWNDVDNNLYPEKSRLEKFVFGLSIGVPLTSKIY